VATRTEARAPDTTRAYRWLAAARRLTPRTPAATLDRRWQHHVAHGRLRALADALQHDEPSARDHAERVGSLSRTLALAIGLTPDEAEVVALAGQLHDIGTICAPKTVDGGDVIHRRHPVIGAQLVAPFDVLALAGPMIRHHHERLDGSGYPDGLRGEAIPIGARIIAVADEYDCLTTAADATVVSHDAALVYLVGQAQRTLDGVAISALIERPLP
jgi:response regulator RpfG family c-di-GMP phosphodiesterase